MASAPPSSTNNPGYISIPLGRTAWKRSDVKSPQVFLVNRYFESTPTSLDDQVSLPLRPTLKRRTAVGDGPIRAVYQQDGVFNGDMFVVSGTGVYRVSKADDGVSPDTVTQITGAARGTGTPYMVAAYVTGGTPYLWLADGFSLQYTDGTTALVTVSLPDDVSATSLDYIKGFVIVTVGAPFAQRFYWITPGAVIVDPLNFAEAESSLDPVLYVKTIGDQFWLFGPDSTEPWYVTGDPINVMAPIQGRPFPRGIWGGTAIKVNDSVILVGKDGRVYDVSSGPEPISYPGVEEQIRQGMRIQLYGDFA